VPVSDPAYCLETTCNDYSRADGFNMLAQPIPLDLRNAGRDPEKHDEMNRQGVGVGQPGDPSHTITSACVHGVANAMAVRRLTPTECERLQGFPDGYTDIQPNGKPTPDGPRYKALGNSMAVPCMVWIGQRIKEIA
jgi:DNA (cytosine-5)-methyltransferase 1